MDPESVVRQLWNAINARDYARLAGAIAEQCDWVSMPTERHAHGEVVVVEWRMAGTNTGPLNGRPPTNLPFARRGCSVATVRGGKIVSYRDYFDRLSQLEQLGSVPQAVESPLPHPPVSRI
jgi:hypothetical protein